MESELDNTPHKRSKMIFVIISIGAVLLVGLTLLLTGYLPAGNQGDPGGTTVVATVNGDDIDKEELYEAMLANSGRDVLDRLIMNLLVMQEAERRDIVVSEVDVDQEIQKVIDESFHGMEEYFHQALSEYGVSEEKVREELETELLLRKIAESELDITEDDERDYFAANQAAFNIREQVEARHILLNSIEEAEEVLQMLEDGADFAALAGEYSKDQSSAIQGGNLGFFERGRMVPEFDEAAFSLEPYQHSEIVESQFGYHIIEVLERQDARDVAFEEVRDEVRERMTLELLSGKMGEQIDLLWQAADVEYFL